MKSDDHLQGKTVSAGYTRENFRRVKEEESFYTPDRIDREERLMNAIENCVARMHKKISPGERMGVVRQRYPSGKFMLESNVFELKRCGFSRIDALLFTTIPPISRLYMIQRFGKRPRLNRLSIMAEYLKGFFIGINIECFYLICLTKTGKLIDSVLMQKGDHDSAPFYFKQMMSMAVQKEAKALVLCHNHPGGTLRPSREDLACTLKMLKTVPSTGILVLDHIIIAKGRAVSIRETGLLPSELWTFQDKLSPLSRKWMDTELLV